MVLNPQPGGPPVHNHPNATETYEVLEGELDINVAGSWTTLKAGDIAAAKPGVSHTYRSVTDIQHPQWHLHPRHRRTAGIPAGPKRRKPRFRAAFFRRKRRKGGKNLLFPV